MPPAGKPEVLIVGKIPADLRQALAAQFELVEGWSLREQPQAEARLPDRDHDRHGRLRRRA